MGESRSELLFWLNDLLQLNVTKVEQCGSGAALCQIYDSIFQDVAMSRVRFDARSEYLYIQNFKVLQNCFTKHQIERTIPVESLVKCKMQDNLEFLQWTKRFWDANYPGGDYDALGRRKGAGQPVSTPAPVRAPSGSSGAARNAPAARRAPGGGAAPATLQLLEMREMIAGLEKERDFYFGKLRDIEILIQQAVEVNPEVPEMEGGLVGQIQGILYSTEEGFENPEGALAEEGGQEQYEEETF